MARVYIIIFDLFRHIQRIRYDFRMSGEQGGHLLLAFKILLLSISEPVLCIVVRIGRQTDEPVVRRPVLPVREMHVIRRHHLDAVFFRNPENLRIYLRLFFIHLKALSRHLGLVQLYFQIIVFPEKLPVPEHGLLGLFKVVIEYQPRNLARYARRTANQPFVVHGQNLVVYPRLVIHTFYITQRDEFHEVVITGHVLRQKYQVVISLVLLVLQLPVGLRHINLATDYRLDSPGLLGLVRLVVFFDIRKKLLDTEHIPVIGERNGRMAVCYGFVYQFLNGSRPIQDGILRMDMKMNE